MTQTLVFKSFQQMAQHAQEVMRPSTVNSVTYSGMLAASHVLHNHVKGSLGSYQEGAGPYPDWAELSERTKRERVDQGFSENNPLYRTGELSRSYEVDGNNLNEVGVGSDLDKAYEMEVGVPSKNVPARPVLGLGYVKTERYMMDAFLEVFELLFVARAAPGMTALAARAKALTYEYRTPMIGP